MRSSYNTNKKRHSQPFSAQHQRFQDNEENKLKLKYCLTLSYCGLVLVSGHFDDVDSKVIVRSVSQVVKNSVQHCLILQLALAS